MTKRKPPYDWDGINRSKKAGKAEAIEAQRANNAAVARREFDVSRIKEEDEKWERDRLEYLENQKQDHQFKFTVPGMDKPRKVVPGGQHDFRLAPFETHKMVCAKCGLTKQQVERDRIVCPDRPILPR